LRRAGVRGRTTAPDQPPSLGALLAARRKAPADDTQAADAGIVTVFVRRGPWGQVHAHWPGVERANIRVDDLTPAAAALIAWGR
jgi:hypothetical protein